MSVAERRMFAKTIIDSDAFLDMPLSTQALYFHLSMRADDDGFINNPKKIQRMVGASDDDLRLLLAKKFVIAFESGVVVIKHWKIHNYIQADRYKPTIYTDEKSRLLEGQNKVYEEMYPSCIQNGYQMDTQVRLGKDRLDKGRESMAQAPTPTEPKPPKSSKHKYGEYGWVQLTEEQYSKLLQDMGQAELERCIAYIDESAQSSSNNNRWKDWNLVIRRCHREGWGLRGKSYAQAQPSESTSYDLTDIESKVLEGFLNGN